MMTPHPRNKSFYASLCATFCVVTLLGTWGLNRLQATYFAPLPDPRAFSVKEGLAEKYFASQVSDPGVVRSEGLFLLSRADFRGLGIRLLENPELFSSVFPGYESPSKDPAFWKTYFHHTFEAGALWSPVLNPSLPERLLGYSWGGNRELFRKEGADLVLVGTSQVFRSLIPGELQRLAAPGGRVLMAARPHMTAEAVALFAKSIQPTRRRSHWIIWGYSPWNASVTGDETQTEAEFQALIEGPNFWARHLSPLLPAWKDLFPLTYEALLSHYQLSEAYDYPDDPRAQLASNENVIAGDSGFWFPSRLAEDSEKIDSLSKKVAVEDSLTRPFVTRHCDFGPASRQLDVALKELLQVTDKVLIYLAPTPRFFTEALPACAMPTIKNMLEGKASERVVPFVKDLSTYQMDSSDFVYRYSGKGYARFDLAHTNFQGALKVTRALGTFLKQQPRGEALPVHEL